MNPILAQIQDYLQRSITEATNIPDKLIDEFGEACKHILRRQFNDGRDKSKFSIYMSNIGRPLCQLKMERDGVKGEPQPYNNKFRNVIGDVTEAVVLIIMKAAGVNVQSQDVKVGFKIGGTYLEGKYDVVIDNVIYDIKSASPYAYENKFGDKGGFDKLKTEDDFGYIAQGYGYSFSTEYPFGGWIVVKKSTGEINITEVPKHGKEAEDQAKSTIEANVVALRTNEPFARCFTDEAEKFKGKETGNRKLSHVCSLCAFKRTCWPDAKLVKQPSSNAQQPKEYWYTYIQPKQEKSNG